MVSVHVITFLLNATVASQLVNSAGLNSRGDAANLLI